MHGPWSIQVLKSVKKVLKGFDFSKLCGNEIYDNLNYGIVKASDYENFKDAKICTNYREWRKCPKHDHLPTKDCILR